MQTTSPLLALALALLPLLPPQDKGSRPKGEKGSEHYWPWGNGREADRIRAEFCGVWELVRVDAYGQTFAGQQCYGHMLAVPDYCSMVARITKPTARNQRLTAVGLDAGTYKWSYDEGRLTLAMEVLLHGNDTASVGATIVYEPVGSRRDYLVTLAADDLVLDRGGNNRLHFRRVQKLVVPEPKPAEPTKPSGR